MRLARINPGIPPYYSPVIHRGETLMHWQRKGTRTRTVLCGKQPLNPATGRRVKWVRGFVGGNTHYCGACVLQLRDIRSGRMKVPRGTNQLKTPSSRKSRRRKVAI